MRFRYSVSGVGDNQVAATAEVAGRAERRAVATEAQARKISGLALLHLSDEAELASQA